MPRPPKPREPADREIRIAEDPLPERGVDLVLVFCTLSLVGLGLVMVYSSSAVFAAARYNNALYFMQRHAIYAALGMVALYVGWRVDYRLYRRLAYPLLALTVVMLVGLLAGLGPRIDGAVRWYRLGALSFQPAELAKLTLVIYLAHSLAKKRDKVRLFSIGFLPHLCVAGLVGALILKQPDLGSTAILLAVTLVMLFVAGARVSYLLIAVLAAAPVAYQQIVGTPWRLRRLIAFLDPWAFRRAAGYQISESLISVGSGGVTGLGVGAGKQKLFFLPAAHTDFIFAITGEELGMVGLLAVVALFVLLVQRGVRAACGSRDLFGCYLAFGITSTFALQAAMHISVVLGLVPTKGITLPLFSYGGTALLMNMASVGVLLNIAARRPEPAPIPCTPSPRSTASANRRRARRVVVTSGVSEA